MLETKKRSTEKLPPRSAHAFQIPSRPPLVSRWWRGEDSNLRRQSRQIYSLIPLAAREPLLKIHKRRILIEAQNRVNPSKPPTRLFLLGCPPPWAQTAY